MVEAGCLSLITCKTKISENSMMSDLSLYGGVKNFVMLQVVLFWSVFQLQCLGRTGCYQDLMYILYNDAYLPSNTEFDSQGLCEYFAKVNIHKYTRAILSLKTSHELTIKFQFILV